MKNNQSQQNNGTQTQINENGNKQSQKPFSNNDNENQQEPFIDEPEIDTPIYDPEKTEKKIPVMGHDEKGE